MKKALRIIIPIVLSLAILVCTAWYLFVYDRPFTRDVLLSIARYSEKNGNHTTAAWFYNLAYTQSGNSDSVAIELAEQYKSIGNYTKAEFTLNNAIADGGSAELYAALSKTFIEQDKLLDAVNMLDAITDPQIKQELDKLRPQAPVLSLEPGLYHEYVTVELSVANGTIYATHNGNFPSVEKDAYTQPFTMIDGVNTINSVCVSDNGLVSALKVSDYTIGGVIKEIQFNDSAFGKAVYQSLAVDSGVQLYSNDLWSITSFTVPKNAKTLNDLQHLAYLESLTIDDFSGTDFTSLSSLTTLTELKISNTSISQEVLSTIAGLPQLQHLTLSNCSLSDVEPLKSTKKLLTLDLSNNALRSLDPLSALKSLNALNLSHNAISNLSPLSGLTSLTSLDVSYNALTTLAPISSLRSLKELHAAYNSISDLGAFEKLTSLTILSLENNQLSNVDALSACTDMIELNIASNTIKDISALSGMVSLEILDFSFNEVKSLPDFSSECILVTINGSNNQITSLEALRGLPHLNNVNMDYNAKLSSVKPLAECPMLIEVNVYGTKVKDVSMLTEQNIIVNYKPV